MGDETALLNCSFSIMNSGFGCSFEAGVICQGKYSKHETLDLNLAIHAFVDSLLLQWSVCFIDYVSLSSNCTDYDVRLHHGPSPSRGTVQICFNGVWGTVCNGGIRYRAPEVLCTQLGYQRRGKWSVTNAQAFIIVFIFDDR